MPPSNLPWPLVPRHRPARQRPVWLSRPHHPAVQSDPYSRWLPIRPRAAIISEKPLGLASVAGRGNPQPADLGGVKPALVQQDQVQRTGIACAELGSEPHGRAPQPSGLNRTAAWPLPLLRPLRPDGGRRGISEPTPLASEVTRRARPITAPMPRPRPPHPGATPAERRWLRGRPGGPRRDPHRHVFDTPRGGARSDVARCRKLCSLLKNRETSR